MKSLIGLLFGLLLTCQSANAVMSITITQGIEGALPIAVVPFGWQGAGAPPHPVAATIAADLQRTGRFLPIAETDLPGLPQDGSQIDFRDWRRLGVENLVVGRMSAGTDGGYQIQFQLFDVYKGSQIAGYRIPSGAAELRRTAHQIADIIYEKLTGERGAFDTQIAYVAQSKNAAGKVYTLEVSDSDGFNAQNVVESTQPILSPAWSPDARRLAYVSFENQRPVVFIQDLATGKREKVSDFKGINSAPAWSPDGQRLALTLSRDGNPEIYVMDLATRKLQRLTYSSGIDTEPDWSPDGHSLIFTSDRGGRPQVYRMSANGGQAKRLTFEGAYNARPRHAPGGDRIALVHGDRTGYHIAMLDPENGALQVLTDAKLDESPSFAPNGAMIIYAASDDRGSALAAVSSDGRVHQRLTPATGAIREPAWSPFLH